MNRYLKILVSFATLFAAGFLQAADSKPIARVTSILEVETDDPSGYATWIAEYNAVAKAKLNVDNYLRLYQTVFDGHKTGRVRVVTGASSVVELTKYNLALENDPAILRVLEHLRGIRTMGTRILLQAVRWEGPNPKGAANYSTFAVVTDEPGYLKALDQLRQLFDANGMKDAKLSAYRVLAGRTDFTHQITISAPSLDRLAAYLDVMGTNQQLADWIASSAKLRTVVGNITTREITK